VLECRHAPLRLPAEIVQQLEAAYGEPHRAYHTAAHVAEVLGWYDWFADAVGWHRPAEVYLAIAFHDAVYDPGKTDNELASADMATSWIANHPAAAGNADPGHVARLILLTARHGSIDPLELGRDRDAAAFLDCDTAILGAEPDAFDAYDRAIAIEYRHVPPDLYRAGRRAFLAKLSARPRIFFTPQFHDRLDAAARANLARAIARLE
jgi:predicted metal-dependent HD superfamily phosphohydrolase